MMISGLCRKLWLRVKDVVSLVLLRGQPVPSALVHHEEPGGVVKPAIDLQRIGQMRGEVEGV